MVKKILTDMNKGFRVGCYVGHVANIDTVDQRILLIPSKRLMWLNWNRRHLSIIYGSVTINGSGVIYGSCIIYDSGII